MKIIGNNRRRRRRQRGVTAVAVIFAVVILAMLSHALLQHALIDYRHGAMVRDTIALQQLTDSALARALYFLGQNDRETAARALREPFGVAEIELADKEDRPFIRIESFAPNREMPRTSMETLFHLARDGEGRWTVVSAENVPIRMREPK